MASINFYLKNPKEEETLIFLFLRVKKSTVKIHTGQKIPPKYWDHKSQRPKKSYAKSPELKVFLNNLEKNSGKFLLEESSNDTTPNLARVKERILASIHFEDAKPEKKEDFFGVYEEFLTVTSTHRSERTIQKYQTLKQQLLDFQKRKKVKVKFENIDIKFFDKMTDYYYNDLKFVNNTFGKYVSSFKTFMSWATDRGYNQKIDYRKFKVIKEDADIVVLSARELAKLYELDLSDNSRLERVRDVFCLGCFTGLRFSDLEQLRPEHFKGNSLLIKTYKTRDTVNIPLREEAQQIINKYLIKPHFLPVVTNQKTNLYLKELSKLAGINDSTTVSRYKGAKRIEFTKPKYEFITTHCARRTFVTLSLEAGVRPELVMSVTGHKSYKTFKKYIKITDKVVENEFQRIWKRDQSGEKSFMKVAN
ncbi:tyrosine-type recombinase/integrase [Catalinimonas sp. 4WD22]|uniref:site-specific integrase n=1 Tax=Catalinimonas locisalis TaxID=3133978 RepID=UPI0031013947